MNRGIKTLLATSYKIREIPLVGTGLSPRLEQLFVQPEDHGERLALISATCPLDHVDKTFGIPNARLSEPHSRPTREGRRPGLLLARPLS